MTELVDLSYEFDSTLVIISKFKDQRLRYDTKVDIISLDQEHMIWELGKLLRITLNKVEN